MPASDTQLQRLIDKVLGGDEAARSTLLDHACDRLLRLARKMFHARPDLRRWMQSDDVFQDAMLRLHRALVDVKPESVRHFFNLAAVQIRRTLLDLAKHHRSHAVKHHTDGQPADNEGGSLHDRAEQPEDLEGWSAFHAQVEALPDDEKEVVGLLFYEGLIQEEAASVLSVSLRTVKRRWHSARCRLREKPNEPEPGQ
jgi:RNA polymerase sigma factor (sigma-70 family)